MGYSPQGCKESDTTEPLNFHFHFTSNGTLSVEFLERLYLRKHFQNPFIVHITQTTQTILN